MKNNTMINEACELLVEAQKNDNETTNKKRYSYDRARRFSCVSYIPIEDLEKFLKRCAWVQHWAMIYHDKDDKEAHTHILIHTYDNKTVSGVQKNFQRLANDLNKEQPQNTMVEKCNDSHSTYRYHRHLDNPEKYQYPENERRVDNIDYWRQVCNTDNLTETPNNSGLSMVQDILDGVSTRAMCERYGKEYIYHSSYLQKTALSISREERQPQIVDFLNEGIIMSMLYSDECPLPRLKVECFRDVVAYLKSKLQYETGEKMTTADIFKGVIS